MSKLTKLTFWFDDDGDGTGRLIVEAAANHFAGKSEAYFSISQIADFADSLTAYPLKEENLPKLTGGFGKQETIAIKVYPVNGRGDLALQIKLTTELLIEERPESRHSVQLEIFTHYQSLEYLAGELKDLINGKVSKAALKND